MPVIGVLARYIEHDYSGWAVSSKTVHTHTLSRIKPMAAVNTPVALQGQLLTDCVVTSLCCWRDLAADLAAAVVVKFPDLGFNTSLSISPAIVARLASAGHWSLLRIY